VFEVIEYSFYNFPLRNKTKKLGTLSDDKRKELEKEDNTR
jgi:hypothetical protein